MRALLFVLLPTFSLTTSAHANNRAQPDGWIGAIAHFQPGASGYTAVNSYLANSLASLVYRPPAVIRQWAEQMGFAQVTVVSRAGKSALLAATPTFGIIAIQGSEFDSTRDIERILNSKYKKAYGGRVHAGGHGFSKHFRSDVEAFVRAHRRKPIYLTGHSMGGLAAVFLAAHLKSKGTRVKGIYTIGMPRMGNRTFRQKLDLPMHFVVNHGDGAAILYPDRMHPNGTVWMFEKNGRLARKKVPTASKDLKGWMDEWSGGLTTVYRRGQTAHACAEYLRKLHKQLTAARRAALFAPLRF